MDVNRIGGKGFHHVAVNARDFDVSVSFYRDGLGFPVKRAWSGSEPGSRGAMLDTGDGSYMEIFEKPDWDVALGKIIHFALRVSDTPAAHERALQAGAVEKMVPTDIEIPSDPPFPATISFVYGPDGEEIEFFQER